jgi:nitrite reductase (NAD(P)H)
MNDSMIPTPKSEWTWKKVALLSDLTPTDTATTSCSVKIGDSQIAIFNVPSKGLYATQQMW